DGEAGGEQGGGEADCASHGAPSTIPGRPNGAACAPCAGTAVSVVIITPSHCSPPPLREDAFGKSSSTAQAPASSLPPNAALRHPRGRWRSFNLAFGADAGITGR